MACSNCNTPNCGCSGTYTVAATCPPTCAEVFNAQCIVYTGTDILCGTDTVIARNAYLDTALTNIVNYICNNTAKTYDEVISYTAGGAALALTHPFSTKQFVSVRVFDNTTDVTSDFTLVMTGTGTYTIESATSNATRVLVVG